ncbi:hypothetical protein LEN26_019715 [Aphanomyces euteiches]|nr:hypothetical protein LEN26_019715 [Aphanomyces euteiches]
MSSQPTSSIEERLVAAADHLDGLVAKISPVQRDVRKVLKEFREFKGSHVKKEDHDQLRSDYERVLKEKREQERQGVKKEDYERLRSEYKASEKDREKRAEEIRALKLEVERLTQARDKYRDQVKQHDQDREKYAKARDQVDRLRSERNGAKEESKRLQSDRLTFGHRFLNWALKNHTLNDEGLLSDVRSRDAWAATNGFTMIPGEPDDSAKLFALPAASPPTDPSGGGSTPKRDESRQDRSTSSGGKSAQPMKGSVKSASKSSDKAAGSGKADGTEQEPRKRPDQGPTKNPQKAPGPDPSRGKKGQENPPGSMRKPKATEENRGERMNPVSEVKTLDKGKKRAAPVVVDASKRPCPSGPPSPPSPGLFDFDALAHEMFGDDDDDAAKNPASARVTKDPVAEKTAGEADPTGVSASEEKNTSKPVPAKVVSKHHALVELHRDICQSRPWRRYLHTAGHFLPDVGEEPFKPPDHAIAVSHFRTETTRFWENCGEEVWKRMFQLTVKADNKAWERIVYQATHLVVELQILIDHSDFDDDLIRFLCFPHPAWPQLFHNPIALSDISGLVSLKAATEYLSSEYSKYWPKVPNMRPDRKSQSWSYALGSTFAVVAKKKPGSSQAKALARRLFNVYDKTGKFKYDPDTDLDRVCQILIRINKVAQEFVKDGAEFDPNRRFPLVTVRPKSDPDFPEEWFGGKEYPKTLYQWRGEADADFWTNPPDASKLENPPDHEEGQDQSASLSEAGSAYEEEDSKK